MKQIVSAIAQRRKCRKPNRVGIPAIGPAAIIPARAVARAVYVAFIEIAANDFSAITSVLLKPSVTSCALVAVGAPFGRSPTAGAVAVAAVVIFQGVRTITPSNTEKGSGGPLLRHQNASFARTHSLPPLNGLTCVSAYLVPMLADLGASERHRLRRRVVHQCIV